MISIKSEEYSAFDKNDASKDVRSLVEAELTFANNALAVGVRDAFLNVLAESSVVFRPKPVPAKIWFEKQKKDSSILFWKPVFADVSKLGELGYTTGPWVYKRTPDDLENEIYGQYVSIWTRQEISEPWQLLIDVGINHPGQQIILKDISTFESPSNKYENLNSKSMHKKLATIDSEFSAKAYELGYVSVLSSMYHDDVRYLVPGHFPILGHKALLNHFQNRHMHRSWKVINSGISSSNDFGYSYGIIQDESGDVTNNKMYLRIWRINRNGWQCVLEIINDLPK